jgi:transcriptional regulator with XRE-family HTH domain
MQTQRYPSGNHRLRATREARGLAQYGLAVLAGTSPTTIMAIERYGHRPRYATRERIAGALNVLVSDLWPDEGPWRGWERLLEEGD